MLGLLVLANTALPRADWVNLPVHALVEAVGGVLGALVGALLLFSPATTEVAARRALAPGLIAMGILDLAHAACQPGDRFVWLRTASSVAGGLLLPLAWVEVAQRPLRALTWAAAAIAVALSVVTFAAPGLAPAVLVDGTFSPMVEVLNVLGGMGLLAAALTFTRSTRDRRPDSALGTMCLLLGAGALLFPGSALWDMRWWFWHVVRLGASAGALYFVFDAFRRAQHELEQEVSRRTHELSAVVRELETFSDSVSHDLRAPLRPIEGFSALLLEREDLPADVLGHLRRIQAAARRMSGLIDDLLHLSRVSRQELAHLPVDLSAVAREVWSALAAQAPGRRVELAVAEGLLALGDPGLLRVLLENLLGNAWKFTSRTQGAKVEVGRRTRDGVAAFYVRDNGAGFDGAQAHRLFTPFERLHAEGEFPGTGIGLATVRRVVERHGGRVWAEGAPGEGATFWFTLPAPPRPPAS